VQSIIDILHKNFQDHTNSRRFHHSRSCRHPDF